MVGHHTFNVRTWVQFPARVPFHFFGEDEGPRFSVGRANSDTQDADSKEWNRHESPKGVGTLRLEGKVVVLTNHGLIAQSGQST